MAGSLGTSSLLSKIGEYEEQLAKNPASDVFVQLAEAYRKMDLLEEASAAIEKGLALHPGLTTAYVAQGRIHAQQGDLEGAVFSFEQVLQRDAKNISGLKGLARVRLMQNAPTMAVPLVKQLMQLRADDPDVAKLKATCEAQIASEKKGSDKVKGAPIKTVTMVDIYVKQGLLEDARVLCQEILNDDPGNDMITAKLAEINSLIAAASQPPQAAAESEAPEVPVANQVPTPVNSKASLVDILEGWLAAINKRRSHVR